MRKKNSMDPDNMNQAQPQQPTTPIPQPIPPQQQVPANNNGSTLTPLSSPLGAQGNSAGTSNPTSPSPDMGTGPNGSVPPYGVVPNGNMPMPAPSHKQKRHISFTVGTFVVLLVGVLVIGIALGAVPTLVAYGNLNSRYAELSRKYQKADNENKKWQKLRDTLSSLSSDSDSDDSSKSDDSDSPSQSNSANLNKSIGDTTTSGSLSMKLNKVEYPQSIKTNGEYDDTPAVLTPKQGNKYLAVSVDVKNDSKSPIDLTCDYVLDISAVNDKNQQYTPIDDLYVIPGNPGCNAELQPGMTAPVEYVFEMPSNTTITGIIWRDETDSDSEGQYASFVFDKKWSLEPSDDD